MLAIAGYEKVKVACCRQVASIPAAPTPGTTKSSASPSIVDGPPPPCSGAFGVRALPCA